MLFINKILPVFLLILVGWFFAKIKLVNRSIAESLLSFVLFPLVPALVFLATSQIEISTLLYARFWGSYILTSFLITIVTTLILFFIFRDKILIAIIGGLFTSISNTALIGLPIALSVLGHKAIFAFTISLLLTFIVFIPIYLIMLDLLSNESSSLKGFILGIFKNPIIISIILGILFSIFQIPLPVFVKEFLGYFNQALVATALFAIGLSLHGFSMSKDWKKIVFINISCLLFKPFFAYIIGSLFGLSNFFLACLVIFNTVPSAKLLFILASKHGVFKEQAASIISLTTLCSIATIPLVIYLFNLLHPGVFTAAGSSSFF